MNQRHAYTAVLMKDGRPGFGIGRADEGTSGYTPCGQFGLFKTFADAQKYADGLNEQLGLSKVEAFGIVAGTMARQREASSR
jgi:hypothetical protein